MPHTSTEPLTADAALASACHTALRESGRHPALTTDGLISLRHADGRTACVI